LLADLALEWDAAVTRGPEAFAREVAAGERGRGPRRDGGSNGWTRPAAPMSERGGVPVMAPVPAAAGIAVGPGMPQDRPARPDEIRPGVPRVSPLRADARPADDLPRIVPAEPIATYDEPAGLSEAARAEPSDEPALPDEARARAASASAAPTSQIESHPDQTLHVRFGGATSDRLVLAMETFKTLLRERPGATRVILHVPAPSGSGSLPMELSRRVAYDAELLSEVRRRLGDGLVDLSLG
jgi:hypothetical protein